jgi:hypothetical protein
MQKLQLVHSLDGVPGSKLGCKAPDIAHDNPLLLTSLAPKQVAPLPIFFFATNN